jgi:hypothetical protein
MARTTTGKPPGWRPEDERYESDGKDSGACSLLHEGHLPYHVNIVYHEMTHPMIHDPDNTKRRDQMVSVPTCWTRLLCLKTYPKTIKEFGVCFPFTPAVFLQMERSLMKDIVQKCPFLHIIRSQQKDYSNWFFLWQCGCNHPELLSLLYVKQNWPVLARQIRRHFVHDSDGEPLDHHAVLIGNPADDKAPGYGEVHVVPAYHYLKPIVTQVGGKRKHGSKFCSPKQTLSTWRVMTLRTLRYEQQDTSEFIKIGK